MHFERHFAFQNALILFFPEKKTCVHTLPKIFRPVTRNTLIFYFALFDCFLCRGLMPEVDYAILSEWYDWIQANEDMHIDLIGRRLILPLSSADNLCKRFGPRSGLT